MLFPVSLSSALVLILDGYPYPNMPLLSRHDIRTWVGLPNARYRESQRAYGALKLMHEPYNSKVAWDWVACELFRVLLGRDGGYVIDAKHNALWHMRGEVSTPCR